MLELRKAEKVTFLRLLRIDVNKYFIFNRHLQITWGIYTLFIRANTG